jgi:hypothetical protein
MKYRPPLGLSKPLDRSRTARIGFKVARPSRWLARWDAPALANLVGDDDRRRRTPGTRAVLRPWTLAGPTDAADALNHTVPEHDADACESLLLRSRRRGRGVGQLELRGVVRPSWPRASVVARQRVPFHAPLDTPRLPATIHCAELWRSGEPPSAGREALVRMNAV